MAIIVGSGDYRYEQIDNWAKVPSGWSLHEVGAVGVDKQDNVYVFNRGEHPMMVFDRDGNFLRAWGEGLFPRAHGLHMAPDDTVFLTDDGDHSVRQCTLDGKVLLTLGTPGKPAPFMSGEPFHRCTHTALSPKGDIYVSDGYGNARVHKYAAGRKMLMSWGESGTEPGQFNLVHNISCDPDGWVYVADRENHRIQVFDGNGTYETQFNNLHRPCGIFMPYCTCPICYVGELGPATRTNRNYPNLGPAAVDHRQQGQSAGAHRRAASRHRPHRLYRPARTVRRFPRRHLYRRGVAHAVAAVLRGSADTGRCALPAQTSQDQLSGLVMSYEPKRFDFSIPVRINLSSDTQTKPSRGMKEAMMEAEVGDEQMGSDPTVWELCDRSAALLGKEAAVFLPSGTMCNQVAIATHCRPGEEILAHESLAHPVERRRCAGGDRRRADHGADRRTRHVHGRTLEEAIRAGVALLADAAPGGSRADGQPRRRSVLESRGVARSHRRGARAWAVHAHGLAHG